MIEDIKHFGVNWIDGMKISKDHFKDLQHYIQEVVRDAMGISLTNHNYGILPKQGSSGSNYNITIDAHKSVTLTVNALHALTPNGCRIEINAQTPSVETEMVLEEGPDFEEAYIMISPDFGETVPFGKADAKEVPPRAPYVTNAYTFSVLAKSQLEKTGIPPNRLPVVKIVHTNGIYEVAKDYIPPCTHLNSYPSLLEFFNNAEGFLKKTEQYAIQIINKIETSKHKNEIADATKMICEYLIHFLGEKITLLKWQGKQMPPVYIFDMLVSLSRVMKNHINALHPDIKHMVLDYYGDWMFIKSSEFENILSTIVNIQYVHYDSVENTVELQKFMSLIEQLFKIFTEVDYIGKRRDAGIFVDENIVDEDDTGGKRKK